MEQYKASTILEPGQVTIKERPSIPRWQELFKCPNCETLFSSTLKDLVRYTYEWSSYGDVDAEAIVVFCPLPECDQAIELALLVDNDTNWNISPLFFKELVPYVTKITFPGKHKVSKKCMM